MTFRSLQVAQIEIPLIGRPFFQQLPFSARQSNKYPKFWDFSFRLLGYPSAAHLKLHLRAY